VIILSLLALIGIIVFFRNPHNKTNQYFGLMVFWGILWILSNYLENSPISEIYRIFFLKLDFACATFLVLFFYLFCQNFPQSKIFPLRKKIVIYSFAFLLFILSFGNSIIKNFYFADDTIQFKTGTLFWFYFSFIFFCLGTGLKNLIFKYKQLKGIERLQILYIFLGVAMVILIATPLNLILPQFIFLPLEIARIGIYSFLLFCFFTALAILKYHLFGIRVILTELLVGIMGIILFLQVIFAQNLQWRIFSFLTLLLFLIFAYYLVKAVHEEERRREEAEKLAQKERELAEKYQVLAIRLMAIEKQLKEMAERERMLREEAERVSQAKSEFIAIVSHQLRTPLSAIKGYLSMILEGDYGKLPEKAKEKIESVYQSNERLIRLVNDILCVSKIESGEIEINLERADLREIIREVIDELSIKAKEKNLYLKFEEPKEPFETFLDKEKIRQVILNLIDNSIRYTQEGGVTVKLQMANGKLQIVVSDTGEGLTKEEKEKLFEKFSRGTAGTKFWAEGAGLGLYIAKEFVKMHNGKIWVESEGRGKGSTFYVELPMK
jgi:signal transduction histidine kinase